MKRSNNTEYRGLTLKQIEMQRLINKIKIQLLTEQLMESYALKSTRNESADSSHDNSSSEPSSLRTIARIIAIAKSSASLYQSLRNFISAIKEK